ncbi:MAG: metal ABC transporter ATP-binding protein [Prevotella sp.]
MQTIVSLDNITAGYDGRPQVQDVSLDIAGRDLIVLTGPNGSGKTTLMRVVLGLIRPMKGTVTYPMSESGGMMGKDLPLPRFGYLPQYSDIDRDFPINVSETVLSGLNGSKRLFARITKADRAAVENTLDKLELTALADRHIKELSGGQLQRVLMARAIVSNPDVMIFDEPTTYTDNRSWQRMNEIVSELALSRAVIVVSHDEAFISRLKPTKLLRMDAGRIV